MSKNSLIDVSFGSGTIVIDGVTVDQFMDDEDPISFQEVVSEEILSDINGMAFVGQKPSILKIMVNTIWGTECELKLRNKFSTSTNVGEDISEFFRVTVKSNNRSWEFDHCTFGGWMPGAVSGNGKCRASRYVILALLSWGR